MQRAKEHIRAVLSRILFMGVSAQIFLGFLWMFLSLDDRQDFGANAYAGVLDGLLPGVSYEPVVYLIQLGVAFIAGYQLIGSFGISRIWEKVWGSLALLTYPYAMQCHMAILPDSLAFSCFLLLLAAGVKKKKSIYVYWILSSIFLTEYFYFGLVPVVVCLFRNVKEAVLPKKKWGEMVLFAAVIVLAVCMQNGKEAEKNDHLEAAWFRRTAWSSMSHFYAYWPENVRNAITEEEYNSIRLVPENVERILLPKVESVLGEEEADKWLVEFGNFVVKENDRQFIKDVVKDAGGYLLPNVFVQLRLDGKGGSSYCNRNYEIMRQSHPLITGYYIQYASWWFMTGMLGTVLMFLTGLVAGKAVKNVAGSVEKSRWWLWRTGIVSGLFMIGWYTFWTAGLWDPKKALFIGCIWILWTLRNVVWCSEKKEASKET